MDADLRATPGLVLPARWELLVHLPANHRHRWRGAKQLRIYQRFGFTKAVAVKRTLDFFRTATPLTIALIPAFRIYFLDEPLLEQSYVSDANSYSGETVPTATQYAALVTADETVDSYSLVTEMSRLTQWQGNIWQRETLYVKAQ